MQILEAYDLCRSLQGAARLTGVSAHTVARYVQLRDQDAEMTVRRPRASQIEPYLEMEAWVERSHGKVRADVCHHKLGALGYAGSERSTRRAVAAVKAAYRKGRRRLYRPWMPEPGLWFRWDWGQGPWVGARSTLAGSPPMG